jgi:hypothetical protein
MDKMKTLLDNKCTLLQIVKPDFQKKYFEIKTGNEVHSTMELLHGDDTSARLTISQGVFTAKRYGFFRPYVTIRREKFDENEAIAYLNVKDGTRLLTGTETYHFKMLNLWKNQWGWTTDKNQVIMRYKPAISGVQRGDIEVSKDYAYIECIDMLAILGIYLLAHLEEDVNVLSQH